MFLIGDSKYTAMYARMPTEDQGKGFSMSMLVSQIAGGR
jgi:hypothetical protein